MTCAGLQFYIFFFMLNTKSIQLPNNDTHNNHKANASSSESSHISTCPCVTEGGASVGGRDQRSEVAIKSQRETAAAFPPRRIRIDCEVKKKKEKMVVRLAAHRENWLLAVFHLRRRGDPEGRSSITAAVFISCFTQSSWCCRVSGGRGRCYSTLTLMCGCLHGF